MRALRFKPFRINYVASGGGTLVRCFGRGEDGKRRQVNIQGTEPFFYASAGCVEEGDSDLIVRIEREAGRCWKTEQPLDKIVVRHPFDVPKVRDGLTCSTWEADVVYENRVRYDLGIKSGFEIPDEAKDLIVVDASAIKPCEAKITPRWCSLDIETWDRGGFLGPEDPRAPVIAIALWDSFTDRWVCILNGAMKPSERERALERFAKVHVWDTSTGEPVYQSWKVQTVEVANEEALFETLLRWLTQVQPDIVVGWNSSKYDMPYLEARADRIGAVSIPWGNFVLFDAMLGFEFSTYDSIPSLSLQYVSKEIFGLKGKSTDKRVWEMMERCRDELVFYNVTDTFLCAEIVRRSGILNFYLGLADRAGCGLEDTFTTGRLVDSLVFHFLRGSGRCQPTKVKQTGPNEKIAGAEVFPPQDALFENVFELDNSEEYPRIMRTFNISPETILTEEQARTIPHITTCLGHHYRTDRKGVFPEILEVLSADRQAAKKAGDAIGDGVGKKLANTFYGVTPSPHYRNGDKRVGSDITAMSREHLKWNAEFCRRWKHQSKILYGDTDSNYGVFLDHPRYEDVEERAIELAKDLNASFPAFAAQFGQTDPSKVLLHVKKEHVHDRFLQAGTKKKYATLYRDPKGEIEHEGRRYKIKVRGFEYRKSDAAQETKDVQESTLKMMLLGASRSQVIQHVNGVVQDWREGKRETWRLGIPQVVNKKQQVLRAAQYSNSFLGTDFRKGDSPAMFFGTVRGYPRTDVFLWEWRKPLPAGVALDLEFSIERVILGPLENVLDLLGIRPSDCANPVSEVEEWA